MPVSRVLSILMNEARRLKRRYWNSAQNRVVNDGGYQAKLTQEIKFFESCQNVHDLPNIFHYWSNKYLVPKFEPFGFQNPQEFFCLYIKRACEAFPTETCQIVSLGSGNCDLEVDIVERMLRFGVTNFTLECLDINRNMLDRGRVLAEQKGVAERMYFSCVDLNSWHPKQRYQVIMAIQCLHHFVELESLFDKVHEVLHPQGFFVTDDMIGRNGHMRWPEALTIVNEFWKELPEKYRYNHQLKRLESEYENWDCSTEGFEGIRSQDILPLLMRNFDFDFFIAFGNVIDIFVDRSFGHNYDPNNSWDREFIDRIHAADELAIENGTVKPTHMMAAMCKKKGVRTRTHKHLSPEFCFRQPDTAATRKQRGHPSAS